MNRAKAKFQLMASIVLSLPLVVPAAPDILMQPTNKTVTAGFPFTISVLATGTGPLTYQWTLTRDGVVPRTISIDGATNRFLTVTNVSSVSAGYYSASISDASGSAVSDRAHVRVMVPELLPSGLFRLGVWNNVTGTVYNLEVTTNLANWQSVGIFTNSLQGTFNFQPSTNRPQRFFRASPLPIQ